MVSLPFRMMKRAPTIVRAATRRPPQTAIARVTGRLGRPADGWTVGVGDPGQLDCVLIFPPEMLFETCTRRGVTSGAAEGSTPFQPAVLPLLRRDHRRGRPQRLLTATRRGSIAERQAAD